MIITLNGRSNVRLIINYLVIKMKIPKSNSGFLFTSLTQDKNKLPIDTEKKMNRIKILTNPDIFSNLAYLRSNKDKENIECELDILWKNMEAKKSKFDKKKLSTLFNPKNLKVNYGNDAKFPDVKNSQEQFLHFLKVQEYNVKCMKKRERVRVNLMSNVEMLGEIMNNKEEFDLKKESYKRKSNLNIQKRSSSMVNIRSNLKKITNPRKIVYCSPSSMTMKKFKGNENFDNFPLTIDMIKDNARLQNRERKEEKIKQIKKGHLTINSNKKSKDFLVSPFIRKIKDDNYNTIKHKRPSTRPLTSLKKHSSSTVRTIDEKCLHYVNKSKNDLETNRTALSNDNKGMEHTVERMKLGKHYGLIKELRNETVEEGKNNGIFVYGKGHQGYHYSNEDRLFSSLYTMGLTSKTK